MNASAWPRRSRASAGWPSSRRSTTTGSSPGRARSAWRSSRTCPMWPSSWSRSVAADSPAASRPRSRRLRPDPRRRRRAGTRGGCARVTGPRRDRPLVADGRRADHRGRHPDPGARRSDVPPPARLPGWDRHGQRGGDRRRRPTDRRTRSPGRRAVRGPVRRRDDVPPRASSGSTSSTGPVVAVVSGGNVDPDRYREYLAAPYPGQTARAG